MEYIIRRHNKLGHLESKWEIATKEEAKFIKQGKDPSSKNSDISNNAEWIKIMLEWQEWTGIQDNFYATKRRVAGMKEAISRWSKKAGAEPVSEPELVSAERRMNRDGYEYLEHITIPVEKSPHIAREAWAWLVEKEEIETVQRIYYHHIHGWVAVYRAMW